MADGYISQIKTPDNKTYLLKDSEKTDEKVSQTSNSENKEFPIILKNTNNTTNETAGVKYAGGVTVNPDNETITAQEFKGNLNITNLIPISTKTYTTALYNTSTGANHYQNFMIVEPTDYNAIWIIHYRLMVTAAGHSDYTAYYDCSLSGRANTYYSYKFYNSFVNYPIYYHMYLRSNSASTPHEIGVRIASSYGADTVQKTIKVELLEQINCTATLLDSLKLYTSDLPSGYAGWVTFNATSNGLQETGDNDTTGRDYSHSGYGINGPNFRLPPYTIFGYDKNQKAQGISLYESGYASSTTAISTTRVYNTAGFAWEKGLWFSNSGTNFAPNANLDFSPAEFYYATDMRYTDNVYLNKTTASELGIVARKPLYFRGTIGNDGLFYLAPITVTHNNTNYQRVWTQDIPDSDDGYVYWFIGYAYYSSSYAASGYQVNLVTENKLYWFHNGRFQEYLPNAVKADSIPLSGITSADDLKAIEAISETTGLLKKTAANTWTLDTSDYVTSSGITSVTIGATSPVQSSTSTAQTGSSASTTISLKDAYGDTKNPYGAKAKNLVLAGPSSGSNAAPTFRALVAADIPDISGTYVKKVTSTDNAIARFDGTSGQIQNSGIIIDDNNNITAGSNRILNNTAAPGQGELLLTALGFKTGYPVYTDPTFLSGNNSVNVYNNSGGGTVTHTRGSYTTFEVPSPGTGSDSIIKIETTGTASPGCGGFILPINARANAQFIQIFRALVPAGRNLTTASNTMGTDFKDEWLTSRAGTGKWEWYARRVICGQEGTMSVGGHVYIDGAIPVTWYLASCNVYDITKTEYDGLKTRYADQANAANITSTQYGIAYYSDTVGTFSGIGAGTSGQYLKSNGTSAPTWASFGTTLNSYGITNAVQYNGIDNDIGSSATAANAKAYWANNNKVPKGKIVFNYNSSGTEFTTLFSNNNNSYGSILRWGYQDTYIRILRAHPNQTTYSGWYTEDWEKISAGYADTAGNITGTLALANLTKGDVNTALMGKGSSTAPAYVSVSPSISITAGTADNAPKVNLTVLGISGTTAQELTKATTGIYGATKLSNAIDSSSEVLAATPKAVKAAYDQATSALTTANNLLATADAMVFKGTLGTGGTITAVPTGASGKEYQAGYTYKVITDGTYAGNVCEAGDLLIAIADSTSGQTAVNNAHWTVVQSNLERYIHYYNNHDNNIDSLIATPYLQTAAANGGNWNGTKPSDSHNGMALFNFQTHSGNYYTQLALDTNQNRLWLRSANNATTFGTWSKIATIADIEALDVSNISGFGTTKTLKTLTQTDGKIAATFQDIAFPVTSVAGKTGAVTLAKGDVGLGNVDNTADANKSVNYATSAGSCTGNAANVTGIVAIANGGTGATTASDARDALFPLTSFTKSITLSNTWQNLGITGADLDTNGTYIIQIYLHSTGTGSLSSYNEYYSGIMSWFKTATNSTDYDEIPLHKAGHASNGKNIYLRTQRVGTNTSPNTLQLQIKASTNTTIAAEIQIKCRLII